MSDSTWVFERGGLPLLVSMPHVGTQVPAEIARRLTPAARTLPDTDWHLPRLYDFLQEIGANLLVAVNSRYVIDLNRDPAGVPLYAGADNTELCPLSTAAREPVYLGGQEPDAAEIEARLETWYRPYHAKLEQVLGEIRARHGYALLFEAHSIKSVLPRYFAGRLPDINLGTFDQASAHPSLGASMLEAAARYAGYSSVLNGRFKGGYITRRYGRPAEGVHAVQLELSWRTYMDEDADGYAFDDARAAQVRPALRVIVQRMVEAGRDLGGRQLA